MTEHLSHTIFNHLLLGLLDLAHFTDQHIEYIYVLLILHFDIFSALPLELSIIHAQILCDCTNQLADLVVNLHNVSDILGWCYLLLGLY
jgi:hypothetical protein